MEHHLGGESLNDLGLGHFGYVSIDGPHQITPLTESVDGHRLIADRPSVVVDQPVAFEPILRQRHHAATVLSNQSLHLTCPATVSNIKLG